MLENAKFIAIEGPIGAGKTSLAKRLAQRMQTNLLLEQPECNPFLGSFYQNMERWALPTQLSFLRQRIEQLRELTLAPGQRLISDFLISKDRLFAELNLAGEELSLYRAIHDQLCPNDLPKADLVIYLQAKPETLFERVRKRGIEAERSIDENYLARVNECYARFFYDYTDTPVFIIDAEVLNPVDADDEFELIYERLRNMRGYREFFGYAA